MKSIFDDTAGEISDIAIVKPAGATEEDLLIYRGSAWSRLPKGTDLTLLGYSGGLLTAGSVEDWAIIRAPTTPAEEDLLVYRSGVWAGQAKGPDGYQLGYAGGQLAVQAPSTVRSALSLVPGTDIASLSAGVVPRGQLGAVGQRTEILSTGTTNVTIPTWATWVTVRIWSAGGSGGSGRRGAVSTNRSGGGGGAGGSCKEETFDAAWLRSIAADLVFSIGAGSAGAPAISVDSTNGERGTAGGDSSVSIGGIEILFAPGGTFGARGLAAITTSGGGEPVATSSIASEPGGAGADGFTGSPALNGANGSLRGAGGGGGGGGISNSNSHRDGGRGGAGALGKSSAVVGGSGGIAPGGVGTTPSASTALTGGDGGGGGAGSTVGDAGAGGAGAQPGGGGGGGGGSLNGTGNSGAGGAGGHGAGIMLCG